MPTPIGSIPSSTIPAARNWILAGIQAQLASDTTGILVLLDKPGPNQPDDIVSVGDVHQTYVPEQTVGSGGPGWLREDYTITVTVDCRRGGDDAAGVFARARQLADLVIAVVRSDPSLGGAVYRARPGVVTHTADWDDTHMARYVVIELGIDVFAVL